jgi:hypothetical protein
MNIEIGPVLRFTSVNSMYFLAFSTTYVDWYGPDYDTAIEHNVSTWANNDVIGITLTGTGNDTTIRIWRGVTADIPDSETSWDSDITPTVTLTANPVTPVDTGTKVGLGAYSTNRCDDLFFGDFR